MYVTIQDTVKRKSNECETSKHTNLIPISDLKRLSTLLTNLANNDLPTNRDLVSNENKIENDNDDLQKLAKSLNSIPYEELDIIRQIISKANNKRYGDTLDSLRDDCKETSTNKKRKINEQRREGDISAIFENIVNNEM